ncbi:dehypoxanthine futalosine cyclase [bacterium]|nr:dehypoxanthine futalosine cyclase [bacterium]
MTNSLERIFDKVKEGKRLTYEDGFELFASNDLLSLAQMADFVRQKKHPNNIVTYIIDRNINYTNVCVAKCSFCSFYRKIGDKESYVLSNEVIGQKIKELKEVGGYQILMQGGLNPALKMDFYTELFRFIKENYDVHIHALSPPEIHYLAKISRKTYKETLLILQEAGLDSVPGGGAEILTDRFRNEMTSGKCSADEWIDVMRNAHKIGMRTTATMMFGSIETIAERLEHLIRLRSLQDETNGFTAFIGWPMQPTHELAHLQEITAFEYLKTTAIARLMLDNFDNLQASWVTQGPKIGQISLKFGINDFGSLMMEENVVSSAGTSFHLTLDEIHRNIKEAGYIPKLRKMDYTLIN